MPTRSVGKPLGHLSMSVLYRISLLIAAFMWGFRGVLPNAARLVQGSGGLTILLWLRHRVERGTA